MFVLEGLLMYLHPESVHATFQEIGRLAGKGSELVFDYVRLPALEHPEQYYGGKQILQSVAKAGEKWVFGIDEKNIIPFLDQYGLSFMEHKDSVELEKMYFTDAAGVLAGGRINSTHCLVRAAKQTTTKAALNS